ncbi:hypothetical protein [Marinobacter sp. SS8-8]|uniref:hypothetical protein n=1 Tax=Marinobacter sp. SS8-8 TaxID=3050452 RepID=UPI0026DF5EB2|nr:hypothetical protein [Marinobacter sp. SS8-8]|tara:strand:+ start:386 stop:751 length:366 start_codon:yes stop_codon:yes gene_type:complete
MKLSNHKTRFSLIAFASVALLILPLGSPTAEEMPESEVSILTEGQRYTGAINSINPEQGLVIIDDRSFILDRVIRFNNAIWSREQVLNRLQPGTSVEIEVGRIVDQSLGARLITQLELLDQ